MSLHTIEYQGVGIEYELLRKDVKYINLRVNKQGRVVVSAGKKVPFSVIEEFVQSKSLWIITHLAEMEKLKSHLPDSTLFTGKTVYFLGQPYQLSLEQGTPRIAFDGDTLHMCTPLSGQTELRQAYLSWLRTQAVPKFSEILSRVYPLAEPYSVPFPVIKIRNMRSIWGSCTAAGNSIRLNLQLMKADESCIEQVLLHELLHFVHPNHSPAFYELLTRLMPDWKERKHRLETKYKDGI